MNTKETNILALASLPVTADADTPVGDVARVMQRSHVGSVVVTRGGRPVGIATDRDLALRVLGRPPGTPSPRVEGVMTGPLQTLPASATVADASRFFGSAGVRRAGVTGEDGALLGVLTFDRLLLHLGGRVERVAGTIRRELSEERGTRPGSHSVFGSE